MLKGGIHTTRSVGRPPLLDVSRCCSSHQLWGPQAPAVWRVPHQCEAGCSPSPQALGNRFSAARTVHTAAGATEGSVSATVQQQGQQQHYQQQQSKQQAPPRYSPLHYNVLSFAERVVPTEEETRFREQVIELIRLHTRRIMEGSGRPCEVQVFGSFATGLSTWSSDVDLVVTGVMEPDRHTGVYDPQTKGAVCSKLRRIGEVLRRCKKLEMPRISLVPRARMPIIKVKVRKLNLDISMSDDMGARAARFMAQQVRAYPPMRPLVLVLKTYLRSLGLNEVQFGGLSSYSLCNMVIAHFQEELKAGRDVYDLGESLYAFLLRYGEEFDYATEAVSVSSGGIVPKQALGLVSDLSRSEFNRNGEERLTVDCPLSGRDVSTGTYRIPDVRYAFQRGARQLEAMAKGRRMDDASVNYLAALFDVNRAVRRSNPDLEYADDYIRVVGRGTNTEASDFQQNSQGASMDVLDEEELTDDASQIFPDSWDEEESSPASQQSQAAAGKAATEPQGGSRGKAGRQGPRGRGQKG